MTSVRVVWPHVLVRAAYRFMLAKVVYACMHTLCTNMGIDKSLSYYPYHISNCVKYKILVVDRCYKHGRGETDRNRMH